MTQVLEGLRSGSIIDVKGRPVNIGVRILEYTDGSEILDAESEKIARWHLPQDACI